MYLNDPREQSIRPESGFTLECDNRIEPMWHWGAMVTDLCGMDPADYARQVYTVVVSGCTGGSGSTPSTKEVNTIIVNIGQVGGDVEIEAKAEEAVASDVYVETDYSVEFSDGEIISDTSSLVIKEGTDSAKEVIQAGKSMVTASGSSVISSAPGEPGTGEWEDDDYIYKVSDEGSAADYITVYAGIYPYTADPAGMTVERLDKMTNTEFDEYPVSFALPQGNGDNAQSQEELDSETYNLVVAVPSELKGMFVVKEAHLGVDVTSQFVEEPGKTETVDDVEYVFFVRNGKDEMYTSPDGIRAFPYFITVGN